MIPRATYRLQFDKDFGFADAAALAPYLARLGVSHVYASPWLKARAGSTHGYDIVDHDAVNPELGNAADFQAMNAAFRENGLRQIVDFVPNHMGVGGADNPLWLDVLEWGPDSIFAGWFDIHWRDGKLLVPFLGNQYGEELYAGKLQLKFNPEEGSFAVWAYDTHKLPVYPMHCAFILGSEHPRLEQFGDEFAHLEEWRPQVGRRAGELKRELAGAARTNPSVSEAINAALQRFNGTPGQEGTWKALDHLIQLQHWRAADFRVAGDDINYRRFFNINELAGLRMELPEVFDHAHSLAFRLLAEGAIDGLRIDHVDGLLNPKEYLQRLRRSHATPQPFYLIVEKILERFERLPEDWDVDGTTGYTFANLALDLLIDPAGETPLTRFYSEFTGEREAFSEIVRECKLRIMRNEMASELNMLATEAVAVARQNPCTTDFTHNVLRRAIREVVACLPVYRTYLDTEGVFSEEDRRFLDWAFKRARTNDSEVDPSVFDFVYALLSGDLLVNKREGVSRHSALRCAMKVQQYSGPVMAKGLEDTAFYRYNRFIALNEVGGDPDQFGVGLSTFHKANIQRAKQWPHSMVSTSTHDTKRGEDTRARLAVLSEIPQEWANQVQAWSRVLRARKGDIERISPPHPNDEYMFYQMLIGSWPSELTGGREIRDPALVHSFAERLKGAMTKSMREAKVHSTWMAPNRTYEDAVLSFVDMALETNASNAFFSLFLPFQERIARLGVQNSLIQAALKLTVPGVPDIYQGSELWNFSFVDPDNRRAVDYERRLELLNQLDCSQKASAGELLACWRDGSIKLLVTAKLLRFRAAHSELFENGVYEPLIAQGPKADWICAFARRNGGAPVVIATALFPARREADADWAGTTIPLPSGWGRRPLRDVITAEQIGLDNSDIEAQAAFRQLPVAVFTAN